MSLQLRRKYILTSATPVLGLLALILAILPPLVQLTTAHAAEVTWANSALTAEVARSSIADVSKCTQQMVRVSTYVKLQSGCYWSHNAMRFGYFHPDNYSYGTEYMISFGADSQFYMINSLNGGTYSMVPNSDIIAKSYPMGYYGASMCIVKDFASHLTRTTSLTGSTYSYDYKGCQDVLTNPTTNTPSDLDHGSFSANGKWFVTNIRNAGAAVVNLDTMQARRFETATMWSPGMSASLAVSNTGKSVVIARGDARNNPSYINTRFYTIDGSCGQSPIQMNQLPASRESSLCPLQASDTLVQRAADTYNTQYRFLDDNIPAAFSDDETSVMLNVFFRDGSNNGVGTDVPIRIKRADYVEPKQLDYLALGDSISSGEGDTEKNSATDKKYYRLFTDEEENKAANQPREKCHQSTRSYPYLLASWMNLTQGPKGQWDSVACSGAKTDDIANLANLYTYQGQDNRLAGYTFKDTLQTVALNAMIPGRVEQIEFVKKYKPKVITLTAGANDLHFGDKLTDCLKSLLSCSWATDNKTKLGSEIEQQYTTLLQLYKDLIDASGGQTKIYVLGYPQLVNDYPYGDCGSNTGSLNAEELTMIVQATTYLNSVIESAAKAAGVHYIETEHSLSGGRICENKGPYVTGIAAWGSSEVQESYHPNAKGQQKIAEAIKEKLDGKSLADYQVCPDANVYVCPETGTGAQNPPRPKEFAGSDPSQSVELTTGQAYRGQKLTISLPEYMVNPVTEFIVSLHSDPVDLGTFKPSADGSANVTINIPETVPVGYHTLIVTAKTYSGEPITYTQTILVTGSDPNDLDANGVPDKSQKCGPFITPSSKDIDQDGIDDACDPQITDPPTPPVTPPVPPKPGIPYVARNGIVAKGEDPKSIYLYHILAPNEQLTDRMRKYVNADGQLLIAKSLTANTKSTYNSVVMHMYTNQSIPTILSKANNVCSAMIPLPYSESMYTLSLYRRFYMPVGFIKLNTLPEGVNCE